MCHPMIGGFVIIGFLSLLSIIIFYLSEDEGLVVKNKHAANYKESDINQTAIGNGYLVWSEVCQIPNLPAHHPSVRQFVFNIDETSCGTPTTKVTRGKDGRHVLSVNEPLLEEPVRKVYQCFYSNITRPYFERQKTERDDYQYEMGEKFYFSNSTVLPKGTEFIYVVCGFTRSGAWIALDNDAHAIVTKDKISVKSLPHQSQKDGYKPSILIVGLDSMSRMNLMRTMPETSKFLQNEGFEELQGYNKIDEHTFPNLMAILTGQSMDEMRRTRCVRRWVLPLDGCDFIWKKYKSQGYATAFIEDTAHLTTFNYQKYGFTNPPTDYYFHHFMVASEDFLPRTIRKGFTQCLGPKHVSHQIYDYCLQFAREFYGQRTFGIFWSNSFSHSELNLPATKDMETKNFLEELMRTIDNSTIFIFLSDHGMRFGAIRETWIGWLEERLPFMFVKFPPSFKNKYPKAYNSFLANRNRLTSPYDLHLTLRHILVGIHKDVSQDGAPSCKTCVSLFHKVPVKRPCWDAGIPDHWCTCSSGSEVSQLDEAAKSAAQFAVNNINDMLTRAQEKVEAGTFCVMLSLSKIMSVRSIVERKEGFQTRYMIVLETKPSQAIFEASVVRTKETPFKASYYSISGRVGRLNMYGNQSYCMDDPILKSYCFCAKKKSHDHLVSPLKAGSAC